MMDTELLDCLFEIDSQQQQDWVEEGYEDNGEETCQQRPMLQVRSESFTFFDFL